MFFVFIYCVYFLPILGEGGEPTLREAPEAVWDWRGIATKEGSEQICEMAQNCSASEEEEDPQAKVEGPTCFEPVHQDS